MKIIIAVILSPKKRTLLKLSALPIFRGGFKNICASAFFAGLFVSIQHQTVILVDSLDSVFLIGEGGGFTLENFPSGFS